MTPAELAERNVGLVYAIAGDQWKKLGGDYDELVGDGMVGLMQAALRFDPARFDGPFSRYAQTRVAGAMVDGYRDRNRTGTYNRQGGRREMLTHTGEVPEVAVDGGEFDRLALARLLESVAELPDHLSNVVAVIVGGGKFKALAQASGVSQDLIAWRRASLKKWAKVDEDGLVFAAPGLKRTSNRDNLGPNTHCVYGHEYTPENTYQGPTQRWCRECKRGRERRRREKRRIEKLREAA